MDPHPTPFPGKRRSVAAPAKAAVPKSKSIATARAKMVKKSPTGNAFAAGAAPLPRPRRAFGAVRTSNALAEKPPPLQKPSKLSPPPLQKPSKVSPPPLQKPSKLSPPNPVRATKPSRPGAKPLKKACPAPDLEAKAKKSSQRVSFQEDAAAAAAAAATGSGEKVKASTDDAAGYTPMVSAKALEKKPAKVVATETPFFSAQDCSSCMLDQLESASYWLAHIRLAESVGKHRVAAAFFGLAFECQAQPIHRIQSELRNYTVRHESAGTLTPLFEELLLAHGMPMKQPKFDTDGFEKVDTPLSTNVVDKQIDATTLKVDGECLECDYGGDLVDAGDINIVKQGKEGMDQPSFERKLDESFEFDDCEAVIADRVVEAHSELENNVNVKVPCDSEITQSACRSSIDKLCLKGSPVVRGSSERGLSSDSPFDKLSPSARSLSAKRLSSGSPFDKKSPFGSASSNRLTSSCPSYKKSSTKGLSSKRMSSGSRSDGEHNATAGAGDPSKVIQDGEFDCHAVDQLELNEHGVDTAINEIN